MAEIVLGLSGGVDSAVAAQLLKNAGWDVTGVFLVTGCDDGGDAEKLARDFGIRFMKIDVGAELEEKVKGPFAEEYLRGRTPNPCIMCNPSVKFPALLKAADDIGAEFVATGHYARTVRENGRVKLLRGRPENDQSYMLSSLKREQLERVVFPLGEYNKAEVREIARESGIFVAQKPDSMEICFIPDNDYAAFIERRMGKIPEGNFTDREGNVLGRHRGIHRYTIGQRRGLGIALGKRVFVAGKDPEKNTVVLAEGGDVYTGQLFVPDLNWISVDEPKSEFRCTVRVRHSKTENSASAVPENGGVMLTFDEPARAPAPGQSAVLYDGDMVLAGGIIV